VDGRSKDVTWCFERAKKGVPLQLAAGRLNDSANECKRTLKSHRGQQSNAERRKDHISVPTVTGSAKSAESESKGSVGAFRLRTQER